MCGGQLKLIHETLESGNLGLAAFMLEAHQPAPGRIQPQGFAWHYLRGLFRPEEIRLGPELPIGAPATLRLVIAPDGRTLAAGMSDGRVVLWDLIDGHVRKMLTHGSPSDSVYFLDFSRDGRLLATGSSPNTIKLWDLLTFQEVAMLPAKLNGTTTHQDGVFEVNFAAPRIVSRSSR